MPSTKYSKIALDSETDGEDQLASYTSNTTKNRTAFRVLISLCVFFAFISAVLAGLLYTRGTVCIDKGLATELEPAKSIIEIVQRRFTGALKWDENGVLFRETNSTEPNYVGEPNPDIDDAWETLLAGLYLGLENGEARTLVGKTGLENGKYLASTDMMHTLHCVNEVRKAIDADYYKVKLNAVNHRMHVDHCLDYIRQSVQCSGDLTTMTFNFQAARGRLVADFDTLHTCRKFDSFHDWALERAIRSH